MAASSGFLKIVATWLAFQGISVQSLIHGDNTFVTCMKDLNNMVFLTDLILRKRNYLWDIWHIINNKSFLKDICNY